MPAVSHLPGPDPTRIRLLAGPTGSATSLASARELDETLADLEAYADGASANLIALAAQILSGGSGPDVDVLSGHAGSAYAIAGLLKALPFHAARAQQAAKHRRYE